MNIAVVGATGMVGRTMLKVLEERNIPFDNFYAVSSERSKGTPVTFNGKEYLCITLEEALNKDIDVAIFSAGGSVSTEWSPKFEAKGTTVIDNSSAWRMHEDVALVVPQINADVIRTKRTIIANPNCSTIQMVMALAPLHKRFGIKRLVISTYQSVTGTGKAAVSQMEEERFKGVSQSMVYPHPIDMNCIPHCDVFLENDYTKEEMKLVHETRKILNAPEIAITATAVRVPVVGGHSESVNIEFNKPVTIAEIKEILNATEGVVVLDEPGANAYPTPRASMDRDEVFVGRIRKDESIENGVNMWIVSDNLRKGAATNAVEILEYLIKENEHAGRIS